MIDKEWQNETLILSNYFSKTKWIRAPASGLLTTKRDLISSITENQLLAEISDPFGMEKTVDVISSCKGIIFAKTTAPMVNKRGRSLISSGLTQNPKVEAKMFFGEGV